MTNRVKKKYICIYMYYMHLYACIYITLFCFQICMSTFMSVSSFSKYKWLVSKTLSGQDSTFIQLCYMHGKKSLRMSHSILIVKIELLFNILPWKAASILLNNTELEKNLNYCITDFPLFLSGRMQPGTFSLCHYVPETSISRMAIKGFL